MQNDVMALVDERSRGGTAQAVGAASDEDASHRTPLYPAENLPTGSGFSLCPQDIARRPRRRRGTLLNAPQVIVRKLHWRGPDVILQVLTCAIGREPGVCSL